MNSPNPRDPGADTIAAYLDGSMAPPERAAFEREIAENPALRQELELQRRIDQRLRTLMDPPPAPALLIAAPDSIPANQAPRRILPMWLKAAAVIALVGLGAWLAIARPWESFMPREPSVLAADVVMKRLADDGFTPMWVCDTDEKFAKYTKDNLGVSLAAHAETGVQLIGWAYGGGLLADKAQILMARAGVTPVIVAMGRRADDRILRTDAGSNLHIHRRALRGLVMYEISSLDHPVVLPGIEAK